MKDEIKEILDIFKKINEEYSLDTELDFEDYEIPNIYLKQFLDYIINLQEIQKEHSIMKQFIYENGLWERFLNDDRFIEHLRGDKDE